jgi:multicomponent Na+:H+ antiporter subunit B
MIGAYPTVVVRVIAALLSPFIAMFGLYVIAHGHYGPGGGFAGGVFLAVGAILPRLTLPEHVAYRLVPTTVGPIAGGIGMLGFLAVGLAPLVLGGAFLDYSLLAFGGMEVPRARYLGILVVEVAVGLAVFGAMILLFDVLTGRAQEPRPQRRTPSGGGR